jgi:hypothetical protein
MGLSYCGWNGFNDCEKLIMKHLVTVRSPIFLLRARATCWNCGSPQEVIALATRKLTDLGDDPEDEPLDADEPKLLHRIQEMPPQVLQKIQSVHSAYEKRKSGTAGVAYHMNICRCGAHFGDFYLFSEPGGAFFPESEEEARQITIEEISLAGVFELACSYGMGTGAYIFEHGRCVQ